MKTGILIGYYVKSQDAREAFRKIWRKGYRRVAWVSKNADGEIHIANPFPWRWVFGATVVSFLFATFASAVWLHFLWPDGAPTTT